MTAAVAGGSSRTNQQTRVFAAVAIGLAALAVLGQAQVRRGEAMGSALLLKLLNIAPAVSLGTAVTFPAKGRYVGFTVAPGCTAALLVVPFLVVAGILLLARRVQPRRAVSTMAAFTAVVVLVNQLRLLVIGSAMRVWGYPTGYDRSHILLGSLVSTIGVAGGLLLFLRMLTSRPGASRG